MKSVAGIFASREAAVRAAQQLLTQGIPRDRLALLTPGIDSRRVAAIPTDEGEAPGTGAVIGAVTGGATGAATGLPIGAALGLVVPGIGPIVAFGLLGAALFGAAGAALGSKIETALTQGVPRDELFVFEDALREGHSVVVALVDDEESAARARDAFDQHGAMDLQTARDRWWGALPEAERGRFDPVEEHVYRCGFESAQWCDDRENVRPLRGTMVDDPVFERGWHAGQTYRRARTLRRTA
jgi:hypothetical protein